MCTSSLISRGMTKSKTLPLGVAAVDLSVYFLVFHQTMMSTLLLKMMIGKLIMKCHSNPPQNDSRTIPAGKKNLNLIKGNWPKGPGRFQKVAAANRSACMGAPNEMKRGWYLRPDKKPGARKNKPGIVALCEIWFYQISRVLLISMWPFIRFVRELALDHTPPWGGTLEVAGLCFVHTSTGCGVLFGWIV